MSRTLFTNDSTLLGDKISQALSTVGITQDRVSSWLGAPCGCRERQEKLNLLHNWAKRFFAGKPYDLLRILND
jgi:hypothetical protein